MSYAYRLTLHFKTLAYGLVFFEKSGRYFPSDAAYCTSLHFRFQVFREVDEIRDFQQSVVTERLSRLRFQVNGIFDPYKEKASQEGCRRLSCSFCRHLSEISEAATSQRLALTRQLLTLIEPHA